MEYYHGFFVFNDSEKNFSTLYVLEGKYTSTPNMNEHMYEGNGKCLMFYSLFNQKHLVVNSTCNQDLNEGRMMI